jgi:hypothetical protein
MQETIKEINLEKNNNQKLLKTKLKVKIRIVKLFFPQIQIKYKLEILLKKIQITKRTYLHFILIKTIKI